MSDTFNNKTFRETYRDYYNPEDGYHRVLYKSGRALQARELIEGQTIIQEEIARFGRNIFKEGALVNSGGATVNNKLEYITLAPQSVFDTIISGKELTNGTVKFKVIEMYDVAGEDPATLYVQYTDTSAVTDNSVPPRVSAGDQLSYADGTAGVAMVVGDVFTKDGKSIQPVGRGTKAHFAAGDFFVQGHFVYMKGGSAFINKYSDKPTLDFGFKIEQSIVTASEDFQLYDNQGEVPDRTAPGADRYKIELTPSSRDEAGVDNFVFVVRIVEGIVTREVGAFDAYNEINNLLAQRTKEESGDYVVEGFTAITENKDDNFITLNVTEGIAYVDGYRLEIGSTPIDVPKANTAVVKTSEPVPAVYGNWCYADLTASTSQGLGRPHVGGYLSLKNSSGATIGFANIRGVQPEGARYRVYLFNIRMNTGRAFNDVTSMIDPLQTETSTIPLLLDSNTGKNLGLYGTADNNLLFPLPQKSPSADSIQTASFTIQKYHDIPSDGSGTFTRAGVEYSQWIVAQKDGPVVYPTAPETADAPLAVNSNGIISNLNPTKDHVLLSYEEVTGGFKTKTLKNGTHTQNITSVDQQARPIALGEVDGVKINSVKLLDTSQSNNIADAEDITHQFTLDGGQRDNFYDVAKAYLKDGYLLPHGTIQVIVDFDYFEHSAAGRFYCATSYTNVEYDEIPNYTFSGGSSISLRDVLDFRPVRKPDALNEFTMSELPQNASAVSITEVSYYLPRIDMLVANSVDSRGDIGFGELQVIQGQPAEYPREPEIPSGALSLYKIRLNPYTFGTEDVITTNISNKRYTMKDIGKMSTRINNLFELTTLSFLELNTNTLTVLDADGLARTKAGFIADNFTDFSFSDIQNDNYRASLDAGNNLRASFRMQSVRLQYANTNPTSVKNADVATLKYTNVPMVEQLLATDAMNVNPFAVITQQGHITLSPASDEWVETRTLPAPVQQFIRPWEDLWIVEDRRESEWFGQGELTWMTVNWNLNFNEAWLPIQNMMGGRIADIEIIPFMRSRRIAFAARGLRPNANIFAFFDGVDVSDWVRQESAEISFSNDPAEIGSQFANATEYPAALGGKSELMTDSKGELLGSFFLPNTGAIQFRTGSQEFTLMDVDSGIQDDALTFASTMYTSSGSLVTRFEPPFRQFDPLAQSFFIDQIENPYGVFITGANIFMASKDSQIPLQVQIRPVENGVPQERAIVGSTKFINPEDVVVTPFTEDTDIVTVQAAPTRVDFNQPIYLEPSKSYAIVLLADSTEYTAYTAQTYQYVLGPSRDTLVSKQPTLGSLFLSQNGSTWTPDQTRDLMFTLDRAEFEETGTVLLENTVLPNVMLNADPFETFANDTLVFVNHEGHGFVSGDEVVIQGVTGGVSGNEAEDLNGTFQVVEPRWNGYKINTQNAPTGASVGGGSGVVVSQQVMYDQFVPQIQNTIPRGTGITTVARLTEGSSYGSGRTLSSNAYVTKTTTAFLNDLNINESPKVVASSEQVNGAKTLAMELNLNASDDRKVSPIIDLQRSSVLALENVIDDANAAQHITIPIAISESSVGLKIIFAANKPSVADFEVYTKTAVDEDALSATDDNGDPLVDWVQADIDFAVPSDDNPTIFRDHEYTIESDPFSVFQIKIVMKTSNTSKTPVVRDLRAIALVTPYGGGGGSSSSTTNTSSGTGGTGEDTGDGNGSDTGSGTGGDDPSPSATAFTDITSLPATLNITGSPRTLEGYNPEQDTNQYGESWRYWHDEGRLLRLAIRFQPSGDFQLVTNTNRTAETVVGADYIDQFTVLATGKWLDRPVVDGETFECGMEIVEVDGQSVSFRPNNTVDDPHPELRNVGTGADLGHAPVVSKTVDHDTNWGAHGFFITEHSTWIEDGKPSSWDSLHLNPAQDITGSFKMNLFVRGDNVTDVTTAPIEVNYTLQGEAQVDDSQGSPLVIVGVSDRTGEDPDPIIASYALSVWKPRTFHDGATLSDQTLEVESGATVDFHMTWGSTDGQTVTVVPNGTWDEAGQSITVNRGDFVQLNVSDTAQIGDDASVTVSATISGVQYTKEVPILVISGGIG